MPALIDKSCLSHIEEGIKAELYAANLYLHLANCMQAIGLFGAQKFFLAEAEAERKHYQIHVDFLDDVGVRAPVPAVPAMKDAPATLKDALETALDTETDLMQQYKKAYTASDDDPVVQQHLLQFLQIQRESVGEYLDLLARVKSAADDPCGILIVDKEMGQ